MKKILSIVLTVCMLLSVCAMPAMADAMPIAQLQTKDIITITVDGNYVDCAAYGQLPVIVEGRTLVPLRSVFEALGATVEWNNETRSVTSVKGDVTITLAVDSKEMVVNGIVKTLDVPAQIMNERTMVPVRAVAEAFGCDVKWDNDVRCVVITTAVIETAEEETPDVVVKKAYDAMLALDFEKCASYYKNPDVAMGDLAGVTSVSDMAGMMAGGEDLTEEQIKLVEKFLKDIFGLVTFEIKDAVISGNTAEVAVVTTTPNFEDLDWESYLTEEIIMGVYIEVLAEMGYTADDLYSMTEEEAAKAEEALVGAVLEYVVEVIYQAAEESEPIVTEDVEKLELVDGKWLIVE